jgi:uncharacterized membrane protein YedE/YeeE
MFDDIPPHLIRAALGFTAGLGLGFVARKGRFCTLGAIEDAVYAEDFRRIRTWVLAAATAIAATHVLIALTDIDLSRSIYVSPRVELGGIVLGGFLFGIGMALVGTCGFGTLLRLGGGDLKALVTFLVLGIAAFMAMRGLTGLARVRLFDPLSVDLAPLPSQRLADVLRLPPGSHVVLAAAVAATGAAWALTDRRFRDSRKLVATGIGIGALVAAGWWITGDAGFDPFAERRVESFTFVAPVGDTLVYAMFASGTRIDFPVGSVLGVVAGAFIAARSAQEFRWEAPDDAREMKRHLFGAFLMGSGGIAALGCTIGQGVTGVSTLSVGSFLAIASILAGARCGLYWLVERHVQTAQ